MADIEVTSTSEEGFAVTSVVDEWELTIDAAMEEGPDANRVLSAAYASCYIPALRVGAKQRGYDDIGRVEIDVSADLDEDDDLESIAWDLKIEADLGDDGEEIVARGEEICHVHSAVREGLKADITLIDDAF